MQDVIAEYIAELDRQYQTGVATEHTHRPALQKLLSVMLPQFIVSNEPARQACGAPDLLLLRKNDNIPVAYVEAKDIDDPDLAGRKKNKEQFDRYKQSLDNIIFTDYLEFLRYEKEKGEIVDRIRIAEWKAGKINPMKENFPRFESVIKQFGKVPPQTIFSSAQLAEVMANKAQLMTDVIEKILSKGDENSSLAGLMSDFKKILIHDITPKKFADVYAQTIVYGMFAAWLHLTKPGHFNREIVAKLIPKTNPFLRQLFHQIAELGFSDHICWVVDDLVEIFRVADMQSVMHDFGKRTKQNDPMIHFYENFLTQYDSQEREDRGVWYTPPAVVNFIVRAVDEILQCEFKLPKGLADSSKIKVKSDSGTDAHEVHKVKILDPAVGTGAFLVETVNQIHEKIQSGMWQGYVKEHLIPRLCGFEILMAPYAMAHLNFDWTLKQKGYEATGDQRFNIFLTNSLEEQDPDTGTFWGYYIAQEANAANNIKSNLPIMVVLGNPPYRSISANKGLGNIEEYKYVDGVYFNERKHWLNDDYVKFIRLGQMFVDKNREGILAYVSNHKFIDNPTFRGMRWNLMRSFDKIYILDLHGDSKTGKSVCPDGSKDENVFDIQQGVSINIFIKTGHKPEGTFAKVYHYDLYGKRQQKYDFLFDTKFSDVSFLPLNPTAPFYFLKPRNETNLTEYEQGFRVDELMTLNCTGTVSANDTLNISFTEGEQREKISDLLAMEEREWRTKYNREQDSQDWKYQMAKQEAESNIATFITIAYRPFDTRKTYYSGKSKGLYARPIYKIMQHFLKGENVGLCIIKIGRDYHFSILVTDIITDKTILSPKDNAHVFPLYLYPDQSTLHHAPRTPNLNTKIVNEIAERLNLKFTEEKEATKKTFAPIDILDYIYAVLHSPAYRERYKEFLKIDFPRVPYPEDVKKFWKLVKWGGKLRRLHLMEEVKPLPNVAIFPIAGSNEVEKCEYKNGKVEINETQFFGLVPSEVWNFYVGGYQPAQKWLKDRKARTLNFDEVQHYQKIIHVLKETQKLMNEIEKTTI